MRMPNLSTALDMLLEDYNGLNHRVAMLSPEGLKTFELRIETRSQTFQLEVRGTKFIFYGRHANKAHSTPPRIFLSCVFGHMHVL